ncbi:unnamed protein product [Penicillium nalgiovense]|nr:unnamed protein product [Penicillium nalgiovense]
MPTKSFTWTPGRGKRAKDLQQRRKLPLRPDLPPYYGFVGVNCQPLELDEDGKHLSPPKPIFFRPQGAAWVAPVLAADSEGEEDLKRITEGWDNAQDHPLVSELHSQVGYVYSALQRMFFQFRRDFLRGDNEIPPNLRQKSKWVESGGSERLVFAEEFRGALWGSLRWSPGAAFVPKKLSYPKGSPPSHTMVMILVEREPSEELSRAEVMTITAAMITRLEGDDCLEYNTIPFMAITIFARMKARIIEAYSSQQRLVMRKTELFDFSTNQVANKNMNILLGFMCADLVEEVEDEDAKGAKVPANILEVCTPAGMDFEKNADMNQSQPNVVKVEKGGTIRKVLSRMSMFGGPKAESERPERVGK